MAEFQSTKIHRNYREGFVSISLFEGKFSFQKVVRKSDFGDSASFVRDQIVDFYGKGAENDDDYLFYLNQYNIVSGKARNG